MKPKTLLFLLWSTWLASLISLIGFIYWAFVEFNWWFQIPAIVMLITSLIIGIRNDLKINRKRIID